MQLTSNVHPAILWWVKTRLYSRQPEISVDKNFEELRKETSTIWTNSPHPTLRLVGEVNVLLYIEPSLHSALSRAIVESQPIHLANRSLMHARFAFGQPIPDLWWYISDSENLRLVFTIRELIWFLQLDAPCWRIRLLLVFIYTWS